MKTKYLFFILILLSVAILPNGICQDTIQAGLIPEGAIARLGKGGINTMRFSPDGSRLAVGTDVGVWLYEVPDGKEFALFTERVGQVNALAFSQDGRMLATGQYISHQIQLWDLNTDSNHPIFMSKDSPTTIAFTQDNTTLISLDHAIIKRRNLDTLSKVSALPLLNSNTNRKVSVNQQTESYDSMLLSQDGSRLVTGTREGMRLWDTTTGKLLKDLKGHARAKTMSILAFAFSPDGKIIASSSIDNTVQLWDTEEGIKLATLLGHIGWITSLTFSTDGKTLASGDANKVIKLWDVDNQRERLTLVGHKSTICALAFAPEGASPYSKCLASGSYDGTIRFWDPKDGEELVTFTSGHTESVKSVVFSDDDTAIATAAFNGVVDVWSLKTKQELMTFTNGQCDSTKGAALSSDASYFARKGSNGFIVFKTRSLGSRGIFQGGTPLQLWNVTTGEEIPGPWRNTENTNAVTISPDNNILVASTGSGSIIGWQRHTGAQLFQFKTEAPHSRKLRFSPNGQFLTSNGTRVKTQVWDITTHRELTPPNMEEHSVLAFSRDNTKLALGTESERMIVLWNITSTDIQEQSRIIHKKLGFVSQLIFSPDGKNLLNTQMELFDDWGGVGYVIKLWDLSGNDLQTMSGHTDYITALAFSPDGKMLASSSDDGTVLLWDWEEITAKLKVE